MIDFFISLYSKINNRNTFLTRIKFYSLQRYFIRVIANLYIPVYYKLLIIFQRNSSNIACESNSIIVSLTTFPARIEKVWFVIESMINQTVKPDKIILWLSNDQFQNESLLPKYLLEQRKRGLEIRFVDEDLRSHKKYYYAMKEFPKSMIITIDDDLFYPSDLINNLLELNNKYPNTICCNRAQKIKYHKKYIEPYNNWERQRTGEPPNYTTFFTSGGGTLFPPGSLNEEVLDKDIFMNYCKYADDVWLNTMSRINNTKVVKIKNHVELIPVFQSSSFSLAKMNVNDGLNDIQIKNVRKFYIEKKNKDPFKKSMN